MESENGVAVGGGIANSPAPDDASSTGHIDNDQRLWQQGLGSDCILNDPGKGVTTSARGKGNDHLDRFARKVLNGPLIAATRECQRDHGQADP